MYQSTSDSGVRTPKGTENEYCQPQNTNAAGRESSDNPEPACWRRRVDDWEWHKTEFVAAFAEMYGPCPECFGAGPPDVSDVEWVVKSCSYPTKYHRIGDPAHADSDEETGTTTVATQFADAAIDAREPIETITELRKGDGVIWNGQSTLLLVVETAAEPAGVANLVGPRGGDYRIEGRPNCLRPYAVRPGYGCQREISRVVLADDRPEAV